MKSYKEYENIAIGFSGIAQLILRFPCQPPIELNFGGDGEFGAYIVDEDAEIGAHYREVARGKCWAWIYDDTGRSVRIDTNGNVGEIVVYRGGDFGCIIQIVGGGTARVQERVTITPRTEGSQEESGGLHITETIDGRTVFDHEERTIRV